MRLHRGDRSRRRRAARAGVPVAVLAVLAAACGGGDGFTKYGGGGPSSSTGGDKPGEAETLTVAREGELGPILVDDEGRTVYLFEQDQGSTSTCYGKCATVWPPVTSSAAPQATGKAKTTLLGTTTRRNGDKQVTYHGHPLYYYAPEQNSKQSAEGAGLKQFGAEWYALSPDGTKVEKR